MSKEDGRGLEKKNTCYFNTKNVDIQAQETPETPSRVPVYNKQKININSLLDAEVTD